MESEWIIVGLDSIMESEWIIVGLDSIMESEWVLWLTIYLV
jgi:hypothetical protein